jgi:NADP-dependent 3-hydroxy acid dehydrogenase YdfG
MEIKDKVIIITGASQGIGLATAKHLSRLGAKVVIAARSTDIIKSLEKELPDSLAIVTDMHNQENITAMIKKTIEKYDHIDILINNAGQGMYGPVEKIDIEQYKKIMDVNVYGVIRAMKEVIPHMRKQGGGMILNISSALTKMYIPGISAYSSTKYALNAISLIARQELAKDKIIVSIVEPNMTATNFAKNSLGSKSDWSSSDRPIPKIDQPEKVAEIIEKIIKSEEAESRVE